MILDLDVAAHLIEITAQYSNAVLVAVLPHISDFAHNLQLPVPNPITTNDVARAAILPWRGANASVELKVGGVFFFRNGIASGFESPHCYSSLQDPNEASNFVGELKMSKPEAVSLARQSIRRLNVPLEPIFADQEPLVLGPFKVSTKKGEKTIPHFEIIWKDPRSGAGSAPFDSVSAFVEVNGSAKHIEALRLSNKSIGHDPPKISIHPRVKPSPWPPINRLYVQQLLPILIAAIDKYGEKLKLRVPRPLTTNEVSRVSIADQGGWPHAEITLNSGFKFTYHGDTLCGHSSPDAFFDSGERRIKIRDYIGQWNLKKDEALALAREIITQATGSRELIRTDFDPKVTVPFTTGDTIIPRYLFTWEYREHPDDAEAISTASVEVNADSKTVKSLYFVHRAFLRSPQNIHVPLSITNQPPNEILERRNQHQSPVNQRPIHFETLDAPEKK